ncbi:MAG: Holliday junction resolvase RuvX [Defluviitaleaceae bacterium]|nr:Holliday junction resolvase RuvX [Defluviitaleaceae bacterium]
MRILSLDYGDRRIGVALSDPLGMTAGGLETLTRKNPIDHKACIDAIGSIIEKYTVSVIVLGLPKNMDGTEGENCRKVKAFANQLSKAFASVEIVFFDERLTTSRARQVFNEMGTNERKKGAGSADKMAAQLILQGYLDKERAKMNDDSIFDMDDVEMESLIVTDDEGNELEYVIIDEFAHKGTNFLVMMKADEDDDEDVEASIFKQIQVGSDDEEFVFEEITEEEYDEIESILKARLKEQGIDLE